MHVVSIGTISKSLRQSFSCGVSELDTYFKNCANQNEGKGLSKTYVLVVGENIVGYYTINMSKMEYCSLPVSYAKRLPKYSIGVGLISKLAVDRQYQNHKNRYGEYLLFHAIDTISEAAKIVGSYAVMVDAKDQKVKEFYLKYGFIPFQDKPLSLFLPIQDFNNFRK